MQPTTQAIQEADAMPLFIDIHKQWGGWWSRRDSIARFIASVALASCHSSMSYDAVGGSGGDTGSDPGATPQPDASATRDDSGRSGATVDAAGVLDVPVSTADDGAAADAPDASRAASDVADATSEIRDASTDAASTSDALEEPRPDQSTELVFVVTYLGGIWGFTVNPVTGAPTLVPGSPFDRGVELYGMAVLPSGKFAYAVDSRAQGALHSYRIDPDGSLHVIGGAPLQLGELLSVAIDPRGQRLYVGDASHLKIEVFEIDQSTGALSARPAIQTDSSMLSATASKDGAFLYFAQREGGIRAFATPSVGDASEVTGSPFGKDVVQLAGAMVAHPAGKFLYGGGTVLNGFEIISTSGALRRLDQSPFSNHAAADATAISVAMDAGGHHLYFTDTVTRTLSAFAIDSTSGTLAPLRDPPYDAKPAPYSVAVDPSGRFVWVGQDSASLVTVFSRDPASGLLTELPDITIAATGLQPEVVFAPYPAQRETRD